MRIFFIELRDNTGDVIAIGNTKIVVCNSRVDKPNKFLPDNRQTAIEITLFIKHSNVLNICITIAEMAGLGPLCHSRNGQYLAGQYQMSVLPPLLLILHLLFCLSLSHSHNKGYKRRYHHDHFPPLMSTHPMRKRKAPSHPVSVIFSLQPNHVVLYNDCYILFHKVQ